MNKLSRYGISVQEVNNLHRRFLRLKLAEGFGTFDDFLKWCSENEYEQDKELRRYDDHEPHGPENSFFFQKNRKTDNPKKPGPKETGVTSPFCQGCEKSCPGDGCNAYKKWWVDNWNEHISTSPKLLPEPEPDDKRRVWRYHHPDDVRRAMANG